jgi:LMBR1 domain-containing protein 1
MAAGLLQTSLIWVTYAVAVALAFIVAVLTTFTWQTRRDRSAIVSTVAVVSLTAVLATVLLLPVDIALISSTVSTHLGAKKDWATPERVADITLTLKIVYYSLYSFDALLCLLVIPFTYFWYEEYDEIEIEEEGRTVASRLWGAAKYTLVFVVLVVALFLVGFFVPAAGNRTGAHWDFDYFKRLLAENQGEKALTFALGLLVTLGTLLYVVYTGAGLALLPVSFIKSAPSISAPQLTETTATALEQNREQQRQIEMRSSGRPEGMSQKDRRALEALMREERTLVRRERLAAEASGEGHSNIYRFWLKICAVLRPIKLLGGIFLLLLSILIFASMLITGIDKAKNSICKQHCGYILGHINIFQPMNWIFLQSSKAFPVDYVLMVLLVLFLFSSSISGIAVVGIRFLWVRIFQIRKGRTAPQALLIATVMLALITLAINYAVAMLIAPQYATFGTQTFCTMEPKNPGEQPNCTDYPDRILPCSEVPAYTHARDVCTPSVMSTFLNRITITWPFFGVVDFWAQFAFLAIFLVVFTTTLFRTPKLNLAEIDEDAEADEEEGLLASTGRRFGATWQDIRGKTGAASGDRAGSNGAGSSNGA